MRSSQLLPTAIWCRPAAIGPPAATPMQVAVEYHHSGWDHYFMTAFPEEIAVIDAGRFGADWQRTGETFSVWAQGDGLDSRTCRFFSTSFAPKSSHFYTPYPDECTKRQSDPAWQYEAVAFHVRLPDGAGQCAADAVPLYRLYNNGMSGAPNHRYTANAARANETAAAG